VAAPADALALDEALLVVAAHDHPVDIPAQRYRLDELAARCEPGELGSIVEVLFAEVGLRGDDDDYHHPDNSFLDRVLDRKRGLPILLSVLMAEVAARCGVCLAPVGMPGHFLLRDCAADGVFVDPFHGGRLLDAAGCEAIFRQLHPAEPFHAGYLEAVDSRSVLARLLTNLMRTYLQRGPVASLAWSAHLRAMVLGGDTWRLAARLRERTGEWQLAAEAWDQVARQGGDTSAAARVSSAALRARVN